MHRLTTVPYKKGLGDCLPPSSVPVTVVIVVTVAMLALLAAARRVRMTLTTKAKDDARVGSAIAAATAAIMAAGKAEQAAHPVLAMADAAKADREAAKSALVKVDAAKTERETAESALVTAKSKGGGATIAPGKARKNTKAKVHARAQARASTAAPIRAKSKAATGRAEAKSRENTHAQAKAQAGVKARAESAPRAARETENLRLDKLEAHCAAVDAKLDRLTCEAVASKRHAEQAEHRGTLLRQARSRDIRGVGDRGDSSRVMCNRVEGQRIAETKELVLRKEWLDKVLGLEKARADRAEVSLNLIRDCLDKDKVGFVV